MEIKKQILLPRNAFALANDEDVFVNLQLSKTFSDIKTEKINNIFNINQQYNIERQASLKFCIYGLIESRFANTGNEIINIKESSNITLHLPKISIDNISEKEFNIKAFELTIGSNGMSRNLYGKTKSAYSFLFEVDKNELNTQDEEVRNNGGIPKTRTIDFSIIDNNNNIFFFNKVPYLFYDLDGNPVSFGTQTADVDEEGNIIEINNDFDFLYDRHWIRSYFDFPAPSFVFFPDRTLNLPENTPVETQISTGLSAGTVSVNIAIDQKSPYGLEEATVIVSTDSTIRNPNQDFNFTTQTIKWNVGEQYKTFDFTILDDKFVESTEIVTLKATFFKNCIAKSEEETKMDINIVDDDIPSQIRFLSGTTSLKSNASAFTFSYVFDKPLEVPGQSVVLYYTTNTDAVLGKDFILDVNNPTAKELKINFNQGDISGSTTIKVIDNDVYDLDKIIELSFKDITQNIVLSNIGAIPNFGPVFRATIQDSLITQFSSFVILNNPDKKIGAIMAYKEPDFGNKYRFSSDRDIGFGIATKYVISINNGGDDIVFKNKLIKKNSRVEDVIVSTQQLTDMIFQLPSNSSYDKPNKRYNKSKYEFQIHSNEQFLTTGDIGFGIGFGFTIPKNYLNINLAVEKNAGPSGSSKYYLTTKLKNFYLNYKASKRACTVDGSFFATDFAYTNNLVFMGYGKFSNVTFGSAASVTDSTTEVTFEDSKMPSFCSQFYPFAFEKLPNPPYKSEYININFRNIYPQSSPPFDVNYNRLKFDSAGENTKRGFLRWSASSIDTRHSITLAILNNGEIPVDIFALNPSLVKPVATSSGSPVVTIGSLTTSISAATSTIAPGERLIIRGFENELQNLSLTLPTNESYIKSKSGFTFANYILSVENVAYFNASGQTSGTPASFKFNSTNTLIPGPLSGVPQYFITTEYSNMLVPIVPGSFNQPINFGASTQPPATFTVDCTSTNFDSNVALAKVSVRGLLLCNSKSGFIRGYFSNTNNDLQLTCINQSFTRIPFRKLT